MRLLFVFAMVAAAALAATVRAEEPDPGLYDRPVLAIDPGMHTAPIRRADVDRDGRFAVTASHDKTVRVWSLADGSLLRTIRLPAGPGNVGKAYAVAISPDGATIAAGGWTRTNDNDIYLFHRDSGTMTSRINGLPNVIIDLAFSGDGDMLAAVLGGGAGLRLYARDAAGRWREQAADPDYGDGSYAVAFAADGRLATTSRDGRLRLYDADGRLLLPPVETPHAEPFGVVFNPTDGRLAVGFVDSTEVLLYDGSTLAPLPSPDVGGIDNGSLTTVAWSPDGATLYAGGRYHDGTGSPVVAWVGGGAGPRRLLAAADNTVVSLRPLPGGALFVAAADPWLGVLAADGTAPLTQAPKQIDPRDQRHNLAVSPDGMLVEFGPRQWGEEDRLRFDVAALGLAPATDDGRVAPPAQDTLAIDRWINGTAPTLDGAPLPLEPHEVARSLAIHSDSGRFLLGTEWWLRAFDKTGTALWQWPVPGAVWAVNVAGDGQLAVAAYGDGTLRWHRMEDGGELMALYPYPDGSGRWVLWTPEGYYAAAPGAAEALGWVVNRGWDKPAEFFPISAFPGFFEEEALKHVPVTMDVAKALGLAKIDRDRREVQRVVKSPAPPGPQLHVLTIGVSRYEREYPQPLDFADDDATGLADMLLKQDGGLYAQVNLAEPLTDGRATRGNILRALGDMEKRMKPDQNDVAVILFSGHGARADGDFYLLPSDVETGSDTDIAITAIDADMLVKIVGGMGEKGKVLVLLDACHSGAIGEGRKDAAPPDIADVREALAGAGNGVIVLSSSRGSEISRESPDWRNGAFSEAVIEALEGHGDRDGDGWLTVSELERSVVDQVREMTDDEQNPTMTALSGSLYETRLFRATP